MSAPYSRGQRQGSVSARELRGDTRSRRTTGWGGVAFLLILVLVIGGGAVIVLGPVYRDFAYNLARTNPQALSLPLVTDIIRDRMGSSLRTAAGTDETPVSFTVPAGATITSTGAALTEAGFIADPMVFTYHVVTRGLDGDLQTGLFKLNYAMTPAEIAQRLALAPDPPPAQVVVRLRQSLRIEQIAAYLQTLEALEMDEEAFYELTQDPPREIIEAYPELRGIPDGQSLEGYMGRGTFSVDADITPIAFLRLMLDRWRAEVGPELVTRAQERPGEFYQNLIIASLVERETGVDAERPKIAGVYLNRLDPDLNATGIMNADPTVVYAVDTMKLRERPFANWPRYEFWTTVGSALGRVRVPDDLSSFQTYTNPGPPAWPIATPTRASIEAAFDPDQRQGFLYFVACEGSTTHKFAKTLAQQQQNINSCR